MIGNYFDFRLVGKGFAWIAIILGLSSCGYTLNNRLKGTFASQKGFLVPVFTNQTPEIGAEIVFTDALIRELQSHGEKITQERKPGALELRGTVTRVDRNVEIAFTGSDVNPRLNGRLQLYQRLPETIGVRAYITFQVVDLSNGKVIWGKNLDSYRRVTSPFNRFADVDAPSSVGEITESTIATSYTDIAHDMMRDLYDSMVEVF